MTKETLFDALGGIRDEYVLAAGRFLTEAGAAPERGKRTGRTPLIAAILAAALALTALAAGLLGLEERTLPAETQSESRAYLSLGGAAGSAEYDAAAEWLAFRLDYETEMDKKGEWRELDRDFAGEDDYLLAVSRLYGAWDGTMLERLLSIAEEHDLLLHTEKTPLPPGEADFRTAGRYENGAVTAGLWTSVDGRDTFITFCFEPAGTLPAEDLALYGPGEYEEWEYTTRRGDTVGIALRSQPGDGTYTRDEFLIFFEGRGGTVTVKCLWSVDPRYDDIRTRDAAERLADSVDFSAIRAGQTAEEILAHVRPGKGDTP